MDGVNIIALYLSVVSQYQGFIVPECRPIKTSNVINLEPVSDSILHDISIVSEQDKRARIFYIADLAFFLFIRIFRFC